MSPPSYMTTSWDDGHPLDLRIAEMLAKHGLTGTFYAPRSAETGVMPVAHLEELGRNFEIGAHTLNHRVLTTVTDQEAKEEILQSKRWVEDVTGRPCRMFCPPRGKFTAAHVAIVQAAGFVGLRTTELASFDHPRLKLGVWLQPTTVQAHQHGLIAFARNAARRQSPGILWRALLHSGSRDWVRMARSTLDKVASQGGVFHLWGHAWEVDGHSQWQRLDEAMRLMSEHKGQVIPLTNCDLTERFRQATPAPSAAV